MNQKLSLKFLEREFLLDPSTGLTRDTRVVVVRDGERYRTGRVIDPQKIRNLQYLDTLLLETELDLSDQNIDLSRVLQRDQNGIRWLKLFRNYFVNVPKDLVNTNLMIERLPFNSLFYIKFPYDYFERIEKHLGYVAPRGRIESLPNGLHYIRIVPPPVRFKEGICFSYTDIRRMVARPDGIIEEYSIRDNEETLAPAKGIFLGRLNRYDIKHSSGEFEGGFPLDHFVEVSYPVAISEVGQHNPLLILVKLKNNGK